MPTGRLGLRASDDKCVLPLVECGGTATPKSQGDYLDSVSQIRQGLGRVPKGSSLLAQLHANGALRVQPAVPALAQQTPRPPRPQAADRSGRRRGPHQRRPLSNARFPDTKCCQRTKPMGSAPSARWRQVRTCGGWLVTGGSGRHAHALPLKVIKVEVEASSDRIAGHVMNHPAGRNWCPPYT